MCVDSIKRTKTIIEEYMTFFQQMDAEIGEDGNEIIRRNFSQGANCMASYTSMLTMIESLVQQIDYSQLAGRVAVMHQESSDAEKRFYFLENRVKMVGEIVTRRFKQMEKARQRMTRQQPVMVIRNPLLEYKREDAHKGANLKLVDRLPSNM